LVIFYGIYIGGMEKLHKILFMTKSRGPQITRTENFVKFGRGCGRIRVTGVFQARTETVRNWPMTITVNRQRMMI